jgi:hypothetical protein
MPRRASTTTRESRPAEEQAAIGPGVIPQGFEVVGQVGRVAEFTDERRLDRRHHDE